MTLRLRSLDAGPLDCRLAQTFAISSASQDEITSVLVRIVLSDGSTGWGEAAPMRPFNQQTQAHNLKVVRGLEGWLEGRDAEKTAVLADGLRERLPDNAPIRAAVETALVDALCRSWGVPLWKFFGGRGWTLRTDYTISVGTVAEAARDAKAIFRRGIRRIKMKVGRDPDLDVDRVLAVMRSGKVEQLILDANQAYSAAQTLRVVKALGRRGVVPDLLEQPVPRDDWEGLKAVSRGTKVPVCADEAVRTPQEALRVAKEGAAAFVNIKLMKSGVFDALDIARICRAAGVGLMVGGMVETRLAMTAAAHLAAGVGGFTFVDLDTPYFLASDPMKGPGLDAQGRYDLSPVRAGIGVVPRRPRLV